MEKFIKEARDVNKKLYNLVNSYLDVKYKCEKSLENTSEFLAEYTKKINQEYIKLLPFIIFLLEAKEQGAVNIHSINKKYLCNKYSKYLKSEGNYDICHDEVLFPEFIAEFNRLYDDYKVISKDVVERAYYVMYKKEIKKEKRKAKQKVKVFGKRV